MNGVPLGMHAQRRRVRVASALAGVEAGVLQVQGVVNGYGERTGNADLVPIAANLVLKMDADCLPEGAVERAHRVAHYVAEVANVAPDSRPYAGRFAFTHKAGLHAAASPGSARRTSIAWTPVSAWRGVVASDRWRRDPEDRRRRVRSRHRRRRDPARARRPEGAGGRGYTFEVADASLELLRRASGWTAVLQGRQLPRARRGAVRRRRAHRSPRRP